MKKPLILGILTLITIGLFAVSCSPEFESNGKRIYYNATSSSGKPIYSQGFTMMHGSITCVNCHGADGRGGTVYMMMFSFEAPDITWPVLTGQHEDHEPYSEETVKDAITKGTEPNGEELEIYMPRWQMADEDLNDLLAFLKTLK